MSNFKNPYARKREIERKLEILEIDKKHFKEHPPTKKQYKRYKEQEEVKNKMFFLVLEKLTINDCIKYFEKELKEVGEIMKTHYIIESGETFNYILACGLKYKDSDNINSSRDINKVTCEKCLKKGGRNSSQD